MNDFTGGASLALSAEAIDGVYMIQEDYTIGVLVSEFKVFGGDPATTHEKSVHAPKRRGRKPKAEVGSGGTESGPAPGSGGTNSTTAQDLFGEQPPPQTEVGSGEPASLKVKATGKGVKLGDYAHPIGCKAKLPDGTLGRFVAWDAAGRRGFMQLENYDTIGTDLKGIEFLCQHQETYKPVS